MAPTAEGLFQEQKKPMYRSILFRNDARSHGIFQETLDFTFM